MKQLIRESAIKNKNRLTLSLCHTVESPESCKLHLNVSKDNFTVLTYNIRSYQKNFEDFKVALYRLNSNIDVIVLTECWLSEGTIIEEIPGYHTFKTSSQINKNGGIVTYIRTVWNNATNSEANLADADSMLLNITNDIILLAIYRSPSFTNADTFFESLDMTLSNLKHKQTILLAGDININIMDLENNQASSYSCLMASHNLTPAITVPTRGGACIDHIFVKTNTNPFGLVCNLSITDHDLAICSVPLNSHMKKQTKRWITKTDWDAVNAEIAQSDWEPIYSSSCVNNSLNFFNNIVTNAINRHTKQIKISRKLANIQPWVTPGLIRCMRQRDKLHLACKANPNDDTKHLIYTRYRNYLYLLLRKLKTLHNKKKIDDNKDNPKRLWTAIKDITCGNKNNQNNATQLIGSSISPTQALDSCNQHFVDVGEQHADKILNRLGTTHNSLIETYQPKQITSQSFFMNPTDEQEIADIIRNLKIDSTPGPDQLTVHLLSKCLNSFIKPITHIFNLSLETGVFPDSWKTASVTPIYKTGPKEDPRNYRPIALLSIVSKILEKIVNKRLIDYLDKNHIISDRQFGFRQGRSTEDAVSLLTDRVAHHIENGHCCIGVFLDLAKAFDTVSTGLDNGI
ncbi:hypothetical protein B5X24_HaOG206296 [Helicoverpa armigera]|nr:hypothetical protein B5X24_HaOG206296 [Helicoverpa armigera]